MTPFPPPGLLPFRVDLWVAARLMPMFTKRNDLEPILLMATPSPGRRAYADLEAGALVDAVKASVARPWRMRGRRCLREGLLAFHYLTLAGHAPLLHFGVIPQSLRGKKPAAHCWISVAGKIILNPPANGMHELFVYDGKTSAPVGRPALGEIVDYA
jgi:Transglutaminase-like superfamily